MHQRSEGVGRFVAVRPHPVHVQVVPPVEVSLGRIHARQLVECRVSIVREKVVLQWARAELLISGANTVDKGGVTGQPEEPLGSRGAFRSTSGGVGKESLPAFPFKAPVIGCACLEIGRVPISALSCNRGSYVKNTREQKAKQKKKKGPSDKS